MLETKKTNNLILSFACYMNLAIGFLPIVDHYCPWYITVIPFILLLAVAVKNQESLFLVLDLFLFIILFFCVEFWGVYRNNDIINYLINFVIAFLPIIFAALVQREQKDINFYRNYLQVAAIFAAITAITTIIGLKVYPMASRELASGTAIYDTTKYGAMNIGGYQYIYAMVMFVPIMLFLIKNAEGLKKGFNILLLVAICLCVYESQYTIALITLVLSFLIIWFCSIKKREGKIFIVIAVILFFVLGGSLLSSLFGWLSSIMKKEYVADRFLQLSQLFSGQAINTGTSAERIEYYEQQINAFFSSPIWGHNIFTYSSDYVSGHSTILDVLGAFGIIGIIAIVFIVKAINKRVFNKKSWSKYSKSVWIMLCIIAILNPVIFSTNILVPFMGTVCIMKIDELSE